MKHQQEYKSDEPLKCVWMTAGVVDYKLCEQEYACEQCAFDRALRGLAPDRRVGDLPGAVLDEQGTRLDGASFYHPAHLWLRVEDEGKVRVGLDDFGQRLTGRIYSVRLPESNTNIVGDDGCWTITHGFGETVLCGGTGGRVVEVNRRLDLLPSLINSDPYGKGWAFIVEPENLPASLKSLFYGEKARRWFGEETHKLRQELGESLELGVTLADGGQPLPNSDFRTPSPDFRIINMFLSARESDPAGTGNALKNHRR